MYYLALGLASLVEENTPCQCLVKTVGRMRAGIHPRIKINYRGAIMTSASWPVVCLFGHGEWKPCYLVFVCLLLLWKFSRIHKSLQSTRITPTDSSPHFNNSHPRCCACFICPLPITAPPPLFFLDYILKQMPNIAASLALQMPQFAHHRRKKDLSYTPAIPSSYLTKSSSNNQSTLALRGMAFSPRPHC